MTYRLDPPDDYDERPFTTEEDEQARQDWEQVNILIQEWNEIKRHRRFSTDCEDFIWVEESEEEGNGQTS